MDNPTRNSDVAFSETVKKLQERDGSRAKHVAREARGAWSDRITPELAEFLAQCDSFYLATASRDGQPYVQHRGGPRGFLMPIDEHRLAMADFAGNRQFITQGNLIENEKACIFLMDYARRRRIKIWGTARMIDDDPAMLASVMPEAYQAIPQRVLLFTVNAWDSNCPQHIPRKLGLDAVERLLAEREERIVALQVRVAELEEACRASGA